MSIFSGWDNCIICGKMICGDDLYGNDGQGPFCEECIKSHNEFIAKNPNYYSNESAGHHSLNYPNGTILNKGQSDERIVVNH